MTMLLSDINTSLSVRLSYERKTVLNTPQESLSNDSVKSFRLSISTDLKSASISRASTL